jgi:DNA invertase Pin-like site-specific DNA recombinase
MTDAYSLIRFSTPKQAKGDSTRRQEELLSLSDRFIAQHDLILVTTIRVEGKSAFHGDHVKSGPLADFLRKVETGQIRRGSWMIAEDMDRIDRRKTTVVLRQFLDLLDAGIVIHTILDNQTYTQERVDDDQTALIISIIKMQAAHEYSKKLSKRIAEKWQARREAMRAGKGTATNACPRWLQAIGGEFFEIEGRVSTIKRVIAMRHLRLGRHAIATELNRDLTKHPTFYGGDGWHPATVAALVKNKALIGIYQPRKADGTLDGPEIKGFYPRLISDEDFWRAQWGPDNKMSAGRTTKGMANLLKGVCRCGHCGAGLVYLDTGKGRFLVCGRSRRGKCNDRRFHNYPRLEAELLNLLALFDYTRLVAKTDPQAERITALRAEIADIDATVKRLLDDFSANTPASVTKRITMLETRRTGLATEFADLKHAARIAEAMADPDAYAVFQEIVKALLTMPEGEGRLALRTRISNELRRVIDVIETDGDDLIVKLPPTRHWQFGFRLVRQRVCTFIMDVPGQPRIEHGPVRLGDQSRGALEDYIDGTLVAEFEERMRVEAGRIMRGTQAA